MKHRTLGGRRAVVAMIACVGLVAASCGDDDDDSSSSDTTEASAGGPVTTEAAVTTVASADTDAPATTAGEVATTEGEDSPATTAAAEPGEPYQIAIVSDMSGPAVSTGGPGEAGYRSAFGEINAAGGVDGHQIEFKTYDTLSTPDGGVAALQAALAEEPLLIASGNNSTILAAQQAVLDQAQVPFVSTVALDSLLYPAPVPWYFTMSTTAQQLGTYVARGGMEQIGGSLEGKRVAIQGIEAASVEFTIAAAKTFVEENGGEIVITERNPFGVVDFSAQAANIAAANPDLVLSFDNAPDSAVVIKAMVNAGVEVPIVGGDAASDSAVVTSLAAPNFFVSRSGREPAEGDAMSEAAAANNAEAVGAYFARGWSAGYMIAEALRSCGFPCDFEGFVSAAEGITDFEVPGDALFGPATWAPDRHYGITKVQFYTWDPDTQEIVTSGEPLDV